MPIYTVETTYRVPVYRQRTYHAATPAEACRQAIKDDDWSNDKLDYEAAGETYVTCIWIGADAASPATPAATRVEVTGAVEVEAHVDESKATAEARGGSGSVGIAVTLLTPNATISGSVDQSSFRDVAPNPWRAVPAGFKGIRIEVIERAHLPWTGREAGSACGRKA